MTVTTSPLYLSQDKKVQLVQVVFDGQPGATGPNAAVPIVRDKTNAYLAGSGLNGGLTGNAAISVDSTTAFDNAEKIIAIATVVLIVVLLGLVFRSVLISVLPIVIIGIVHQMAQALTADLADWFGFIVGPELAPLLVVVMFGVGTDYFVFMMFRHRERMAGGDNAKDSLRFTVERVGEVIASAGATVIAAFAALLVASLESLKTLAPGLIAGIALDAARRAHADPGHPEPPGQARLLADATAAPALQPADPLGDPGGDRRQAPGCRPRRLERGAHRPGLRHPRLQDDVQPAGRAAVEHAVAAGVQHDGRLLPGRLPRADPGLRRLVHRGPARPDKRQRAGGHAGQDHRSLDRPPGPVHDGQGPGARQRPVEGRPVLRDSHQRRSQDRSAGPRPPTPYRGRPRTSAARPPSWPTCGQPCATTWSTSSRWRSPSSR